jgi:SAM-dependent methyltransferase
LQNPEVAGFVKESVKAGYAEFFAERTGEAGALVDQAFERLAQSQRGRVDPQALQDAGALILASLFRKGDGSFWFNQTYHRYKAQIKPEIDFEQLKELIRGERVLDYGCGSGYLALRLEKGGYTVFTTDVLDYRLDEARHLPFVKMTSPMDIAYPDDGVDTAIVQAVLHHIDAANLSPVLGRLRRIAGRLVIKEDTYALPAHLDHLGDVLDRQPLLRAFLRLPLDDQFQALALIDYFANVIAQGIPEMNFPFQFKTVPEWESVLNANGLQVVQTIMAGFEARRMHKSCHVWLVCERV